LTGSLKGPKAKKVRHQEDMRKNERSMGPFKYLGTEDVGEEGGEIEGGGGEVT